jgi:dihydrofolate reductase
MISIDGFFEGPSLSLIPTGLINEYRVVINSVMLGHGRTILSGLNSRFKMKLMFSKTFSSGNVLLCYSPATNDLTQSSFLGDMIN